MIYDVDFEDTIREFDYTKRAIKGMHRIVNSEEFQEMDSEAIFEYLYQGMELVSFKDYLKRYLYERAGIREKFSEIDDSVYREIINDAFNENAAPHSFNPTTKKWTAIMKGWLSASCVKRQTVFLLGFGLRMQVEDVSDFLVKIIKEEDFNFYDQEEVIYWYCFSNHKGYLQAKRLLEKYDKELPAESFKQYSGKKFEEIWNHEDTEEIKEEKLLQYLSWLKSSGICENNRKRAYRSFESLLENTREIIADIYNRDAEEANKKQKWNAEKITPGDVEKIICSGIPMNENGNLKRMSASLLQKQFQQYRISRQRIDGILKGKLPVERFDILTLNFFIYSQREEQSAEERCRDFVKNTNAILKGCGMLEIYPVNPYETYILICLLSECPLAIYSDIWELSYQNETI